MVIEEDELCVIIKMTKDFIFSLKQRKENGEKVSAAELLKLVAEIEILDFSSSSLLFSFNGEGIFLGLVLAMNKWNAIDDVEMSSSNQLLTDQVILKPLPLKQIVLSN